MSEPKASFNDAVTEFIEGFEIDTGEGIYSPTEHERFVLEEGIRTFLAYREMDGMSTEPAVQQEQLPTDSTSGQPIVALAVATVAGYYSINGCTAYYEQGEVLVPKK